MGWGKGKEKRMDDRKLSSSRATKKMVNRIDRINKLEKNRANIIGEREEIIQKKMIQISDSHTNTHKHTGKHSINSV